MKSVIISGIIALMLIGGSLIYTRSLENVSAELSEINGEISECLQADDYDGADARIERLSAYLDSRRAVLDAIGDHEEIDKIEMNISELEEYSRGEKKTDALSKCRVLDFLFEHLPLNYKLRLENIL